jgi:hypothetical protein
MQNVNSSMRRIDLACELIVPLGISLLDAYSTKVVIWVVLAQTMIRILSNNFSSLVSLCGPWACHGEEGRKPISTIVPSINDE